MQVCPCFFFYIILFLRDEINTFGNILVKNIRYVAGVAITVVSHRHIFLRSPSLPFFKKLIEQKGVLKSVLSLLSVG